MEQKFVFEKLPVNENEFVQLDRSNPFNVAAHIVVALLNYHNDVDSTVNMLNFLGGPKDLSPYEKQFLRDRLVGKEYLVKSFFEGSSVDNNYSPSIPYTIVVKDNIYSESKLNEGYITLYVHSSGADFDRGIVLRKKQSTNEWFFWDQMILSDIRIPKEENPWA